MAYDRMDWHYGGQFPQGLPHEAGGTHIGMYMAWAFSRGMASDELREDAADELALLAQRAITGREVLIDCCDEKFWAEDLTPEGQAFTQAYYGGESAFAAAHSTYLDDYCAVFNADAERQGFEYASTYHVANTWANFDLLAPRLDTRLAQWHAWCADPAHAQADPQSQFALTCAQIASALAPHGFKPNKRGDELKLRLHGQDTVLCLRLELDRRASETRMPVRPFVWASSKRVKAWQQAAQGGEPSGHFLGTYLFDAQGQVDWDIAPPQRDAAVADLLAQFAAQVLPIVALLREREAGLAQLARDGRWQVGEPRGWTSATEVSEASLPYVLVWGTPEQAQQWYGHWLAWQYTPARQAIVALHARLDSGALPHPNGPQEHTAVLAHAHGLRPPADWALRPVRGKLRPAN